MSILGYVLIVVGWLLLYSWFSLRKQQIADGTWGDDRGVAYVWLVIEAVVLISGFWLVWRY
jgi:heme/copper-type cytochrome/quinol oxidase subunit 2